MEYTDIGSKHFKIVHEEVGDYPNSTTRLTLTVGQYQPVSFDPRFLDELINLLTLFRDLNGKENNP